jgi:hypothetical protein
MATPEVGATAEFAFAVHPCGSVTAICGEPARRMTPRGDQGWSTASVPTVITRRGVATMIARRGNLMC